MPLPVLDATTFMKNVRNKNKDQILEEVQEYETNCDNKTVKTIK